MIDKIRNLLKNNDKELNNIINKNTIKEKTEYEEYEKNIKNILNENDKYLIEKLKVFHNSKNITTNYFFQKLKKISEIQSLISKFRKDLKINNTVLNSIILNFSNLDIISKFSGK
jgi:mevalonate kinase